MYTCNYTMTVTATSSSGETQEVVIRDMMIGEVWVCSGQSNMRFMVRQVSICLGCSSLSKFDKGQRCRDGNREGGWLQ